MNTPYIFKVCNKCRKLLPATTEYFHKNKIGKYGLQATCKKCRKEYYENNKEIISKKQKDYRENNKERKKEYRENNKEIISKKQKEYYEKNKEIILEYQKEYYENNKEIISKKQKDYRENNKERIKEYKKEYRKNNKEIIQEYKKEYRKTSQGKASSFNSNAKRRSKLENQGKGISKEQWLEMMRAFDWKCAYSGEEMMNDNKANSRTIDHIIALENRGVNEIWNLIPMKKRYNSSKNDRIDTLTWYKEQEYFSEERLAKIVRWQIYAYIKWATKDDEPLILITN